MTYSDRLWITAVMGAALLLFLVCLWETVAKR